MRPILIAVALFVVPIASVSAQDGEPSRACTTAEFHQFDFWVGDWTVTDADGTVVGHNRIEAVYSGCGLREEWTSVKGWRGGSLTLYDATRGAWHQTWIDQSGRLLLLDGGLEGAAMVLTGTTAGEDGSILHEIRWTPLADGRVRQHWRRSNDDGATWEDVFVGFYARE
jgi:hypothetical protein